MTDRRQRRRDLAAQRAFDKLLANPASYPRSPATSTAVVFAVVVICAALAAVALLVWATTRASGVGWFLVVLGWACVIVVRPRAGRLERDVQVLDPADFPGIHGLVAEMARAVGVRPPEVIGVDVALNAYVAPIGWTRRNAMVLGLPLMSLGTWDERLGVIGHELGHLRGRDTPRIRVIGAAGFILSGVHYLVAPAEGYEDPWAHGGFAYESTGSGFFDDLARWVQTMLALPFIGLLRILDRLDLSSGQHREYLADRRSAEVVGSSAMVDSQLRDLAGLWTAAAAAARRGEDPFAFLESRPALDPSQSAARLLVLEQERARVNDTHPPGHLRIKLLQAAGFPPSAATSDEPTRLSADAELSRLRDRHRRELVDQLVYDL